MGMPEALGALRERPFRLLFVAQTASVVGDNLAPIALAFAVIELGGTAVDLGLVLAARAVPMVLLLLPAGVVADRFGRRRVMIVSDLVSFATQAGVAALLIAGKAEIWQLVALQVVYGSAAAVFLPAASGLVPETVSPERLQQANALRFAAIGAAGVAGPVAAGVLVTTVGSGWALAADAATFAFSAIVLTRLATASRPDGGSHERFRAELVQGWREVRARTWVWVSILDFAVFQLVVFGCFYVLGPLVAEDELSGASSWAAVVASYGLGVVLGSALALRIRADRPLATAFLASLAFAPALVLLGFPAPVPALAAGWALAGVALGFGSVLWETTLQERIPSESRSRVAAYDWLGSVAIRPVGYLAIGPIAELLGRDTTLWLGAALLTLATVATLSVPDIRRVSRWSREPESEHAEARLAVERD